MINKTIVALLVPLAMFSTTVSADALKNSLTNMMNKEDKTPGMVDLSRLGMSGSPQQPQQPKTRSSKAVVATVNGTKIIKKDADAYLGERTKGQVSNFDLLPKEQRIRLLQEMSVSQLAGDAAQKELTQQERSAIYTRIWMQKEAVKNPVTDAQIQKVYDDLKKRAVETNSTKPIPEFETIKANMKMKLTEQGIVDSLMKDVNVTVIDANMIAGSVNGMYISIDDANNALSAITQGKATWRSIPKEDKDRVLKMIAPSKLMEIAAEKDLSDEERSNALTNFWMQNKIMKTEVNDKELQAAYAKIKKQLAQTKSKQKLPEFEQLEDTLHMQVAKEKVVAELMKNASIKLK
jgi:hypothetical protein